MRYVHNDAVGSIKSLVSGSGMTSRLGVRGVEDLGEGLTASFNLGTACSSIRGRRRPRRSSGTAARLSPSPTSRLGEVRPRPRLRNFTNWARFDPFGYTGAASASNFINTTAVGPVQSAFGTGLAPHRPIQQRGAIRVAWRELGGVEGVVMVAAGEGGLSANAQHKLTSARLGYGTDLRDLRGACADRGMT